MKVPSSYEIQKFYDADINHGPMITWWSIENYIYLWQKNTQRAARNLYVCLLVSNLIFCKSVRDFLSQNSAFVDAEWSKK